MVEYAALTAGGSLQASRTQGCPDGDGRGLDGWRKLPIGKFAYVETWHDGCQKRALATEFDAFQPAMADGRKVLDLVGCYLARKPAIRLMGEQVALNTCVGLPISPRLNLRDSNKLLKP